MAENKSKVEVIESMIVQLKDLHHSSVALVEKIAALQLKAMEGGVDRFSDKLGKPFSSLSENAKAIEEILKEAESERTKLKKEAEKGQAK